MKMSVIGVDFDNTIVSYGTLFAEAAIERGLIPTSLTPTKESVRDYLRDAGQERSWTELQGEVYGNRIRDALPFAGVQEFFARCSEGGAQALIISQRTQYPFLGPQYDLHDAGFRWLRQQSLIDSAAAPLDSRRVFFESSKQDKLDRIQASGCHWFIDDLPELLSDPGFPSGVQRILFDPGERADVGPEILRCSSWATISAHLLG